MNRLQCWHRIQHPDPKLNSSSRLDHSGLVGSDDGWFGGLGWGFYCKVRAKV